MTGFRRIRLLPILGALALALFPLFASGAAHADGSGSLGQSTIRTQTGNYSSAGVGFCATTPCSGSGVIFIGDVPAGSTVTDAFLYWDVVSTPGAPPGPTSTGAVNGVAVTGTSI